MTQTSAVGVRYCTDELVQAVHGFSKKLTIFGIVQFFDHVREFLPTLISGYHQKIGTSKDWSRRIVLNQSQCWKINLHHVFKNVRISIFTSNRPQLVSLATLFS